HHQGQLLDRAGTLFCPRRYHGGDRDVRRAQFLVEHGAGWAPALRRHRRNVGISFHVHLLDDSEKSDRSHRSRDILFPRDYLSHEFAAAQRDADSRLATNYLPKFWRGLADEPG